MMIVQWFGEIMDVAPFIVFFVSIMGFHILLIRCFPLSDFRWRAVDYIWLSTSIIGVLATISDMKTAAAIEKMDDLRGNTKIVSEVFTSDFTSSRDKYCIGSRENPPDRIQVCKWFESNIPVAQAVSGGHFDVPALSPTDGLPQFSAQDIAKLAGEMRVASRFNQSLIDAEVLVEKKDFLSKFRTLASIFLLPIALGLRFTKTTGEILLAKKKLLSSADGVTTS